MTLTSYLVGYSFQLHCSTVHHFETLQLLSPPGDLCDTYHNTSSFQCLKFTINNSPLSVHFWSLVTTSVSTAHLV